VHQPFENLIEPFDDDDGAQQADTKSPLKCESDREVNGENVFRVKDFGHVHEESFAFGKPLEFKVKLVIDVKAEFQA